MIRPQDAPTGRYCLSSFKISLGNYSPMGKRRFATLGEALAAAVRAKDVNGYLVMVDIAPEARP